MERRLFLRLSAFTAAAISLSTVSCGTDASELVLSKPAFFSRFADQQTIHDAGTAYLRNAADENSTSKLIALLKAHIDPAATDPAAFASALEKKIRHEFDTGTTVIANGWILSLTEARQCALFSLL